MICTKTQDNHCWHEISECEKCHLSLFDLWKRQHEQAHFQNSQSNDAIARKAHPEFCIILAIWNLNVHWCMMTCEHQLVTSMIAPKNVFAAFFGLAGSHNHSITFFHWSKQNQASRSQDEKMVVMMIIWPAHCTGPSVFVILCVASILCFCLSATTHFPGMSLSLAFDQETWCSVTGFVVNQAQPNDNVLVLDVSISIQWCDQECSFTAVVSLCCSLAAREWVFFSTDQTLSSLNAFVMTHDVLMAGVCFFLCISWWETGKHLPLTLQFAHCQKACSEWCMMGSAAAVHFATCTLSRICSECTHDNAKCSESIWKENIRKMHQQVIMCHSFYQHSLPVCWNALRNRASSISPERRFCLNLNKTAE